MKQTELVTKPIFVIRYLCIFVIQLLFESVHTTINGGIQDVHFNYLN
jgi:hypothetical protein